MIIHFPGKFIYLTAVQSFLMLKLLVLACFTLVTTYYTGLPNGWTMVDKKASIANVKLEVYFFDYMSRVQKLRPDIAQHKGREFTNILEEVQFQFPSYVAKQKLDKEDSAIYYILRPNASKKESAYFFDLQVVKLGRDFPLQDLEDLENYKQHVIKTIAAKGCRGSLVCEHSRFIQDAPDKKNLIGNGIQITDSIFTRVIPFEEIKKPFYNLIEANL